MDYSSTFELAGWVIGAIVFTLLFLFGIHGIWKPYGYDDNYQSPSIRDNVRRVK